MNLGGTHFVPNKEMKRLSMVNGKEKYAYTCKELNIWETSDTDNYIGASR